MWQFDAELAAGLAIANKTAVKAARMSLYFLSASPSFTGQNIVKDKEPLITGGSVVVDENALAGPHKNQLPLNDQLP